MWSTAIKYSSVFRRSSRQQDSCSSSAGRSLTSRISSFFQSPKGTTAAANPGRPFSFARLGYTASMDFRARRQLAVLGVIALVVGGIGFLIFRAGLPDPSCQDNRKNQGEEDTDCGGPCASCALREQKPVEIFWTRFVQVRANTYDVAAEVRNPNVRIAAVFFDYEFKLFDTAGVAVVSRRGRAFLYPGETAHLIEIGLLSGVGIFMFFIPLAPFVLLYLAFADWPIEKGKPGGAPPA